MALTTKKGFTVNTPIIVFFGLLLIVAAIVIYLYVLKGVYGRFTSKEVLPSTETITSIFGTTGKAAAILYSKYTEKMLPEGSTWLDDNITTWKKFLSTYKIGYDIISDKDLEDGKHTKYKLLILPGAKSLSDEEVTAIKKYIDAGGSVFATSGTASYSQDGKWRGWEFFSEVFGLKFIHEVDRNEVTKIHTLRGNLPITANIPTGFPLKVATWDRPIAVEVLEPRTIQISFWYNYRIQDGLVKEEVKKSAGIAAGSYGRGRFVWMGFEINSVVGVQEDYIYFDKLFHNSLSWLYYSPVAYVKDWPGDYESAALIVSVIGEQPYNIKNLLPILSAENVKATFFVEPTVAENNGSLINSLANFGDVGTILDIGYLESVNDTINKLDNLETQKSKIEAANKKIVIGNNQRITGLLPYYGLFDDNSLSAIAQTDLKYIITDSLTDRSVPRTIIKGEKTIISITKTARDDYDVVRNYGLTQPEFQLYTYKEDVDRLLFEGGLYLYKIHTEYQCQAQYVGVVRDLIQYMKKKKIWIANASEIYNWWIKKNKIEMRVESRSKSRLAVTITNPGEDYIEEFLVEVDLQVKAKNIEISSEIIGTELPTFTHNTSNNMVYLRVQNLKAGQSRLYYIDYDRIEQ